MGIICQLLVYLVVSANLDYYSYILLYETHSQINTAFAIINFIMRILSNNILFLSTA